MVSSSASLIFFATSVHMFRCIRRFENLKQKPSYWQVTSACLAYWELPSGLRGFFWLLTPWIWLIPLDMEYVGPSTGLAQCSERDYESGPIYSNQKPGNFGSARRTRIYGNHLQRAKKLYLQGFHPSQRFLYVHRTLIINSNSSSKRLIYRLTSKLRSTCWTWRQESKQRRHDSCRSPLKMAHLHGQPLWCPRWSDMHRLRGFKRKHARPK